MLWTAQGALTLAYATEGTRGRLIALFWVRFDSGLDVILEANPVFYQAIFNLGAVLGAAIQLGLTFDSGSANTVSNSVYIAFLIITAIGCLIPIALVNPATMVRVDNTRVVIAQHPSKFRPLEFPRLELTS